MMNSMKDCRDYCVGCFYNGVNDGYKPECLNCPKVAEYKKAEDKKATFTDTDDMLEHIDGLLPFEDTAFEKINEQNNKKSRRSNRRIYAKKFAKKAPKSLQIVNAKYGRLPVDALPADFIAVNKKCFNADKKAVYKYRTKIALTLPAIPKGTNFGQKMENLISNLYYLLRKDISAEMNIACKNAISYLETVQNGEIVGLHREGNILHLTVGFRDKISMTEFIQKTA